jgi:S-disulfanyl-L-cysteine oxidoreductase SoxD
MSKCRDATALILRSARRARLEGWPGTPSLLPSFETAASRPPQDEGWSSWLRPLRALFLIFAFVLPASAADRRLNIGRDATPAEIAGWDIDIRPDGQGLPVGSGSVKAGEAVYMGKCAACHGEFGESAGRWPQVAGGQGSLAADDPVKTVGSYFAHLSTVIDYVRHAMPFGDAQSLSNDELYAVVAYMLFLNDIVHDKFVLSKDTFATVKMPNAGGFYDDDRETTEKAFWNPQPCMTDCKADVKITGRARVIDVTPDEKAARKGVE